MIKIIEKLVRKDPVFYTQAIEVTKDILGIHVPINAPSMAKVAAAKIVREKMSSIFIIPDDFKFADGVIIFSIDINATLGGDSSAKNTTENFLKSKWQTLIDILTKDKKLPEFNEKYNNAEMNWRVGNFFKGKFLDRNGKQYSERSICILVSNVSSKLLQELAGIIAQEFYQESVLVQDGNNQKIYLLLI
ncbi:hypothetical protein NitYY0826_C1779 [Nitratiruptor sp. YY08-26]|uniref:hypothetical protein n=1 Tax=unclassified Nitratiruptor TaxID=2624044 RepID=UPI0019153B55|nr:MULTISPECIES: hypothetical protein [unclassified Nitratiruptor]BCD62893.1 hypothetical protein NitYY0813_C1777 [Nitratiruptor sp. YY08-13]BCD66829.1 hypothetical protein NitYY0826_C1779 [Nitratiruptor sp. YY08-26]